MNIGRGDTSSFLSLIVVALWLGSSIVPLCATAQQQPNLLPGYNPWASNNPYYPAPNPAPVDAASRNNRPASGPQPYNAVPPWAYPTPTTSAYPRQNRLVQQVSKPYLEVSVDSTEAYVHQNLVLSIKVVSTVNLKTVSTEMPQSDGTVMRQLGEVTVSTRNRQAQREIVNTLYYQLTPVRSGRIELEAIRVTGIMDTASPGQSYFDVTTREPTVLTVLDPQVGVRPWLPLHELELTARLSNDERIGEGEPLTLTIEQRAVGMSGAQLPSPEAQLRAPGHRLYREKSEYDGTITKQGKLVGTRKDRFTLVPQQGNQVDIPAIRVDWWNVDRKRKETAVLPGRLLNQFHQSPANEETHSESAVLSKATGWMAMWLSLVALAFLLGRFWTRLTPALERLHRWLWPRLVGFGQPLLRHLMPLLARLSPQRNLPLLRRKIADSLPRSARLWFCVRSADEEQDADDWSQVLRFLVSRRLGLSAQLPMSSLAEQIIDIHPGADADKIRSLLNELEAALFAGRPIADFDNWKREFKKQVRPRFYVSLRRKLQLHLSEKLPDLNPTITPRRLS
jgi:hypothetical protein